MRTKQPEIALQIRAAQKPILKMKAATDYRSTFYMIAPAAFDRNPHDNSQPPSGITRMGNHSAAVPLLATGLLTWPRNDRCKDVNKNKFPPTSLSAARTQDHSAHWKHQHTHMLLRQRETADAAHTSRTGQTFIRRIENACKI